MFSSAIADVIFKSVFRELFCVVLHDSISGDLCENGGCCDAADFQVAFDDRFERNV